MKSEPAQQSEIPSLIPRWGWLVIGLALINLMVLHATTVPLSPRELTYWAWGQNFALSYDGHGPLLPWLIGISTFALGDTEFDVRFWGPLFAAIGTGFTLSTASRLFDVSTAQRYAPFVMLMPVISIGSLEASIAPLAFCFAAITAWAITTYLLRPRFRYMIVAGISIGLGMMTHPGLVLLLPGLAISWLMVPALRHLMRLESWAVLTFGALIVASPYLLSGEIAWLAPQPSHSGMLANLTFWVIAPFFGLIWLLLFCRFWAYPGGVSLMVWLMVPVSFLSLLAIEPMAAAIAPTYVALVGLHHFGHSGTRLVHIVAVAGHGAITLIALALLWNPYWDAPLSNRLGMQSNLLAQHYHPRAVARLIEDQWQNGAYGSVATDNQNMVPALRFYGPAAAPLFWIGDGANNSAPMQTESLPFVADKPILILTDNMDSLNHPRLTNITVLSRTIEKTETVWITASAFLKVKAE